MLKKLVVLRNFLYRLFVVGVVFDILTQLLFLAINGFVLAPKPPLFGMPPGGMPPFGLPPHEVCAAMMNFIGFSRTFLVYFVLCPALALHWTVKREKSL